MKEGIDNIEVELTNMNTASTMMSMTKDQGSYAFTGVDVFDPKSIGASRNNDLLNGVSTLDLVLIQRHILGLQIIDSPYKLLAADINNSRSVTASDLTNLRKTILGVSNQFDNNTSWRFLPETYKFDDPAYPFDFPSKINLDSVFEDRANVNFMAVKVGDINNSAKANAGSSPTEKRSQPVLFVYENQSFKANETVKVEIRSAEEMEMMGAQLALHFAGDKLTLNDILPGKWAIRPDQVNRQDALIRMSYDDPKGTAIGADEVLFTLVFTALEKGNTNAISLANEVMPAELYDLEASAKAIALQPREGGSLMTTSLYQNEPNPFKDGTSVPFELATASSVTLRVLDVTGKQVFVQTATFEKGYHTLTISGSQLSGSGVYYYQLEADGFTASRKMILIE
jgi:hypothetical protein